MKYARQATALGVIYHFHVAYNIFNVNKSRIHYEAYLTWNCMQDGNSSLAPRIHPQGVMAKVLPVRVENIEIKDVLR